MRTDDLHRELRRYQDILSIVGTGVMLFGVWSLIQSAMMFILQMPQYRRELGDYEYAALGMAIIVLLFLILISVDLLLRGYIWRSARREAARGARRNGYLIAAGALALIRVLVLGYIIAMIFGVVEYSDDSDDLIVTAVISATEAVTLIEMIVAAVRVRRISERLGRERG